VCVFVFRDSVIALCIREHHKMMKAIVLIGVLALCAKVQAQDQPDFEYEWVPYEVKLAEPYVNDAPPKAAVVETEERQTQTIKHYVEYEYEIEYEYEGNLLEMESFKWEGKGEEVCTDNEIPDCNNKCAPQYWIANGLCDDGLEFHEPLDVPPTYMEGIEKGNNHFVRYNFNCEQFWFDGGDCEAKQVAVDRNYKFHDILGGRIYGVIDLQKIAPSTPVLAVGVLAVVAVVGAVMKR
jgi:hypothetical protein